jgi:hypothetical protein
MSTGSDRNCDGASTSTLSAEKPRFVARMARAYRILMEHRQEQADREISRRRAQPAD